MGKSEIPIVPTFECRSILDSIQNEFDQLQKEDNDLGKLHQDLGDLIAQRNILSKRKGFNEKYCVLCCSAFNLLFKRKLLCCDCHFNVCRSCSSWDYSSKQWLCSACEKQRLFNAASREWLSNRIKTSFGNFSAAKALQNFYRNRRISDSENDSGYGAAGELPLMKLLSSHSLIKDLKMTDLSSHDGDCEDEDEEIGDEEELAEIHYSIETILEGLLGGTLDDALVDQLYPNSRTYMNAFSSYHVKLVEAIQNLSKALQKALHNLPSENGITPTTAHAALKNVITALVEECQEFPPLQATDLNDVDSNISSAFDFMEVFSSYDSLVAAAVINKIVEESQSKYKKYVYTSLEESLKIEQDGDVICNQVENTKSEGEVYNTEMSAAPFDFPVECVQIEEVEEITQEFTDSEDDKLSSISKWSNSLQSIDEVGCQRHPDMDIYIDVDHMNHTPVPFPEFGFDLVDEPEKCDSGIICHPTVVTTWEENWLFRKKKRLPLYSNLKYQLLTYCDEPPCMLIPCPSENNEDDDQEDFSSELSETHSAGSIEFSSDLEETEVGEDLKKQFTEVKPAELSKSEKQAFTCSSPIVKEKDSKYQKDVQCHEKELREKKVSESKYDHTPLKTSEEVKKANVTVKIIPKKDGEESSSLNHVSPENTYVGTPPRPGTIAEREHKKWMNAAPLKNNPYSAENIYKRSNRSKAISKEPIASFEEFERKLSVSSDTSETVLNKVNCGPKTIDTELYKRDYYINHGPGNFEDVYPIQKSTKYYSDDVFESLPDEALNSFEEKVYVRSGKVFTLENRIKRLEREIKDPSSDHSRDSSLVSQDLKQASPSKENRKSDAVNTSVTEQASMSSVKAIDAAFKPDPQPVLAASKSSGLPSNKTDVEKVKKAKPCRKVHSLTARSLSREFRDLAKINQPKPMNRTIQVSTQAGEDGERESLCSPESVQSSLSTHQVDNGHGYTSDESNTSSHSTSKQKTRRHISRAILERATYWERRAEHGLLSDASVSEEFPGIDINPE